jgi:hypothetical protein
MDALQPHHRAVTVKGALKNLWRKRLVGAGETVGPFQQGNRTDHIGPDCGKSSSAHRERQLVNRIDEARISCCPSWNGSSLANDCKNPLEVRQYSRWRRTGLGRNVHVSEIYLADNIDGDCAPLIVRGLSEVIDQFTEGVPYVINHAFED